MNSNNDPEFKKRVFRLVEDALDSSTPDANGNIHLNIEVGRDMVGGDQIIVQAGPSVDPNHHNATTCPQCERPTWRYSRNCIECGYDLFAHAEREQMKVGKSRLFKIMATCGLFGIGAIFLAQHLPKEISLWSTGIGVLALIVAAAASKEL